MGVGSAFHAAPSSDDRKALSEAGGEVEVPDVCDSDPEVEDSK